MSCECKNDESCSWCWEPKVRRSKPVTAVVHGPRLGGGATGTLPDNCIALADLLPYAPPVDRADLVFDVNDTAPQCRTGYDDSPVEEDSDPT